MKHQIGEILNIESADGEFYVYGHITDPKQIMYPKDSMDYPNRELIQAIHEEISECRFDTTWSRCMYDHSGDYNWVLTEVNYRQRGAMPVTIVRVN